VARHGVAQAFGVAADVERQVFGFGQVLDGVHEGVEGLELLALVFDVLAEGGELGLRGGADAGFESPAAEEEDAGLAHAAAHGHHGVRVVGIVEFALEDFGPEEVLVFRQGFELQTRSRGRSLRW
jgi:hypothetical protein